MTLDTPEPLYGEMIEDGPSPDDRRVARVRKAIKLAEHRGWRRIVERAYPDGRCVYCGRPAESRDHVVPVSRGGQYALENLVPACHRCNNAKRNLLPAVFFERNPKAARHFARLAVHAKASLREMAQHFARQEE